MSAKSRTLKARKSRKLFFYVGDKIPRKIQNFSVCLGNASAKKNWQMLSRNLCISRWQWLRHASAFCQGLWFVFWTVDTTYFTNIILFTYTVTHLNGRNRRQYLSLWSPCFGFCGCLCYNRRTYYPTLEKPGAQNITPCENQVSHANWVITEN